MPDSWHYTLSWVKNRRALSAGPQWGTTKFQLGSFHAFLHLLCHDFICFLPLELIGLFPLICFLPLELIGLCPLVDFVYFILLYFIIFLLFIFVLVFCPLSFVIVFYRFSSFTIALFFFFLFIFYLIHSSSLFAHIADLRAHQGTSLAARLLHRAILFLFILYYLSYDL